MISKISLFKNLSVRTKSYVTRVSGITSGLVPKMKALTKDVFQRSKVDYPEVITGNPRIVIGKYDHGIKDSRFVNFGTEYRAYDFEGYDTVFPNKYVCIDSNGERRLKPHIYLNIVEVKPEFARQGAYSDAIKKLKAAALAEEGCEGRIVLDATKIEGELVTKIPSPSLAHWKCGFRFANEENNKIMERVMKGELPLTDAPEGTMYYPL